MPSVPWLGALILPCTLILLKLNHVLTFPTESELSLHNTSKFLKAAQQALQRLQLCSFYSCAGWPASPARETAKARHSQERLVFPGSTPSAMSTATAHKNCPWDLKADSPHPQSDFVPDIVSFQQCHILCLSEQLLPILATHFRRQTHTWFSCMVSWENRAAISKCL